MHSFFMLKRETDDEQRSPNASPATMERDSGKYFRKPSSRPMTLINGARDPERKFRQVHREYCSEHLEDLLACFEWRLWLLVRSMAIAESKASLRFRSKYQRPCFAIVQSLPVVIGLRIQQRFTRCAKPLQPKRMGSPSDFSSHFLM